VVDARSAERPEGAVGATSWHSPPVSALLEVDRPRGGSRCDWLTPDASDAGARPSPSPLFNHPEEAVSGSGTGTIWRLPRNCPGFCGEDVLPGRLPQ